MIIDYVEGRKPKVSGSTVVQYALKHFFEINDIEVGINWSKIVKIVFHARKTAVRTHTIRDSNHARINRY